jgi:voltage-gated potassium channel
MNETMRSRVWELLGEDERSGAARRVVSGTIFAAVGIGVLAAVLGSVPGLTDAERALLQAVQGATAAVLAAEWLLRLWVAPEADPALLVRPWAARRRYLLSAIGVIDLAAILPALLSLLHPVGPDWLALGAVIALFKLVRYLPALSLVGAVLAREGKSLMASLVTMAVLLVVVSTAMYVLERDVQPEVFKSIPHAMWWGIVTMATVGYGDMAPQTGLGRVFGGMTMLLGIAMFAVPAGILATGFAEELRKRDFVVTWHTVAKVPLFAGLDATRIASIARLLKPQIVPANAVVVRRGDPADAMFFIMEGEVAVDVAAAPIRLKAGQYFGEIALLDGGTRTATVAAVGETRLLMLESADFAKLTAEHPSIREAIAAVAATRRADQ